MSLKSNPLLPALGIVVIGFLGWTLYSDSNESKPTRAIVNNQQGLPITTQNEVIAQLGQQTTIQEQKLAELQQKLDAMSNQELSKTDNSDDTYDRLLDVLDSKLDGIKAGIERESLIDPSDTPNSTDDALVQESADNDADTMPFKEAFDMGVKTPSKDAPSFPMDNEKVVWVHPEDLVIEEKDKSSPTAIAAALNPFGSKGQNHIKSDEDKEQKAKEKAEAAAMPIPFATIHADSSIHNATSLTALIGRIQRDGDVVDGFKFQVVLSGETLMANGLEMPEVANAIVSGTAYGDYAFSCVRGAVTSVSFNFQDGRIYNQKGKFSEPLAYLGDKWGNPCIEGVLVDDLAEYIAMQGTIGGLSAYAENVANSQQVLSSADGIAMITSRNNGKAAVNSFAAGGLDAIGEVLSDRFENYYEAIYVPPGQKVSLYFEQPIAIDYIPTNRKVSYDATNYGYSNSLD